MGKLLLALETALTLEQVGRFPGWKLHPLKGDMKGYWSVTVPGNWRIVFRYHEPTHTASDMDLIDEKAFGPDMDHLLRMQLAYDVAQTRSHAKKLNIKRYVAA